MVVAAKNLSAKEKEARQAFTHILTASDQPIPTEVCKEDQWKSTDLDVLRIEPHSPRAER